MTKTIWLVIDRDTNEALSGSWYKTWSAYKTKGAATAARNRLLGRYELSRSSSARDLDLVIVSGEVTWETK